MDGDEEVSQAKKSNLSKKLTLGMLACLLSFSSQRELCASFVYHHPMMYCRPKHCSGNHGILSRSAYSYILHKS